MSALHRIYSISRSRCADRKKKKTSPLACPQFIPRTTLRGRRGPDDVSPSSRLVVHLTKVIRLNAQKDAIKSQRPNSRLHNRRTRTIHLLVLIKRTAFEFPSRLNNSRGRPCVHRCTIPTSVFVAQLVLCSDLRVSRCMTSPGGAFACQIGDSKSPSVL